MVVVEDSVPSQDDATNHVRGFHVIGVDCRTPRAAGRATDDGTAAGNGAQLNERE
jgi:hypothetical protein